MRGVRMLQIVSISHQPQPETCETCRINHIIVHNKSKHRSAFSTMQSRRIVGIFLIISQVVMDCSCFPSLSFGSKSSRTRRHQTNNFTSDTMAQDSDEWKTFDTSTMSGVYGMGISAVAPRPIAVITSKNENGVLNCAPFS